MVKTRGNAGKTSTGELKPVKKEDKNHKEASGPPKKRQKRSQGIKEEVVIKDEDKETAESATLPAGDASKIAKASKKIKKQMQTAHTADDLPAIQRKASKV